jgi:hypothetical protein
MRRLVCSLIALLLAGMALADDGEMFRKNVSSTPDLETEFAAIRMLPLYVPPQSSDGTLLPLVEYYNADGALVETREYARPLITHYTDGHVDFIDAEGYGGFPGHGKRDAWGAVSLDDGATWKRTNLSKSGDLSSFRMKVNKGWVNYPGDVGRTFAASDGNKVLIVWVSRYAKGGSPTYAMTDDELSAVATYMETEGRIESAAACTDDDLVGTPCLYLEDHFSVAGSQGSSDLADEGYPLVGELPYAAVWVARGVMLPPDADGLSRFVWFKAERLSSAVRDANRPEAVCVKGAGCVVTWQEDPDGIRPGEGEGPGEGWSGAVAHHQTDIWYSHIDWDDFGLVSDGSYGTFYETTGDLATWVAANPSGSPQAAIPMAIPVRLTDNSMCVAEGDKPYCYADFNVDGTSASDFCASSVVVNIDVPDEGSAEPHTVDMCITEDGRLLRGNTGSTRARIGLHGYSTNPDCVFERDDPDACPIDSAWFYMAYEENKGLGDEGEDEVVPEDLIEKVDMGKNVWYHTFDMFQPELVSQGLMLNQPAVYPDDFTNPEGFLTQYTDLGYSAGETNVVYNFYRIDPDPIYETQAGIETTTLLQSEIARRPSPISQDWYDAGPSGLVGFQLWKQGIVRRGGPADIMGRRFVMAATGEEECTTEYQLCTTEYEQCTTTYEQRLVTQDCHVESVLVRYAANPAYKPNASCTTRPTQLKCYPYIDGDGNPTYEEGYYVDEQVCVDVETWVPADFCDVSDAVNCRVDTNCAAVDFCDVNVAGCTANESCGPTDFCDVDLDAGCTATNVCTGGLDDNVNPYGYANMVCENADGSSGWAFTDGSNPRYVKGLCAAPAANLSATMILTGESCADAATCLDAFPFNDYFDDIDMTDSDPISKILTWQQFGPGYGETPPDDSNLDDTSWANPYEMAKGHRGFLAGDMVMVMYGWTNNWKALTDAHDIVNLYIRRSFDGGVTWSTVPASFTHTNDVEYKGDGTTTCEWMGETGSQTEYPVCVTYGAGEFEQARNVSQLLGHQVTVLDPRYSPTTRSITPAWVSTSSLPEGFVAPEYLDDTRDPSRFFMIYETGMSSAYDAGEAPPLDLFYSRAIDWGDDYLVWQDEANEDCLPAADPENTYDLSGFCNEFDALEGKQDQESGEASVTASPGGQFFYAVWNQWDFDRDGNEVGADAWFRRVLFLDDYIPPLE